MFSLGISSKHTQDLLQLRALIFLHAYTYTIHKTMSKKDLDFIIRPGKKEDVPFVLELIQALAAYEKAPDEVENTVEQLTEDGFGPHPLYGLYVAEVEQNIVGIALYFYRYSTWKGKLLYLEDLYVKPEYRQKKIAYRLLQTLIRKAKEEKCRRVFWQVLDWNEPAINFYKGLGGQLDPEWVNVYLNSEQYEQIIG